MYRLNVKIIINDGEHKTSFYNVILDYETSVSMNINMAENQLFSFF